MKGAAAGERGTEARQSKIAARTFREGPNGLAVAQMRVRQSADAGGACDGGLSAARERRAARRAVVCVQEFAGGRASKGAGAEG